MRVEDVNIMFAKSYLRLFFGRMKEPVFSVKDKP